MRRYLAACEASAVAGALLLLLGMLVVLADIATRRTVGSPLTGVNDLVQLAVVGSACLALPLAFARGTHVAVDFVTRDWPSGLRRGLDYGVALAQLALLWLLVVHGWGQAALRLALGDVSPTLGLPILLYWVPYLVGIALSLPAALIAPFLDRAERPVGAAQPSPDP